MRNHSLRWDRALTGSALVSLGLLFASAPVNAENDAAPALGFVGGAPALPNAMHVLRPRLSAGRMPEAVPPTATPAPVQRWSDAEELAGRAHCARVLARLPIQFTYLAQMRSGACGAPSPIEITGLGAGKSAVAVSPPLVVNCDLAAALYRWLSEQVQPLARRHLGTSIIQLNTMSSYSCRNRYGARQAPLSQHAFANAIDVRGFITARGELIDVELHWGPTEVEEAVHAAALARTPAGAQPVAGQARRHVQAQAHGALPPSSPIITGSLKQGFPVAPRLAPQATVKVVATGQPAILGASPVKPGQRLDGRAHFLRHAHGTGCGLFGTVLGPESNRWHRNHLHFDLAQRKSGPFCQ